MNHSDESECAYYGCYLEEFRLFYGHYKVPVGLIVCAFGTVTNTLNIIVLCQKRLRKSPTNALLTVLSIAQLALLSGYLLHMLLNYLQDQCNHFTWTFGGAVVKLVVVNVNNVLHTVAFGHTLYIALLRVLAVRCPIRSQVLMSARAAWLASLLITLVVIVLCLPGYLSSTPDFAMWHPNCTLLWGKDLYSDYDYYDLAYANNPVLVQVSFLMFSVFLKLIPCLIIVVLISILIISLRTVERRRNLLLNKTIPPPSPISPIRVVGTPIKEEEGQSLLLRLLPKPYQNRKSSNSSSDCGKRPSARSRTTKMLITVVLVCVSVELPHGLLHLISALEGDLFAQNVYDNLGDVIEMLTLLYSSINFVIYCCMSSDFLQTFKAIFCSYDKSTLSRPLVEMSQYITHSLDARRLNTTMSTDRSQAIP